MRSMSGPSPHPSAGALIDALGLVENPHGGWFRQVHECRPEAGDGRSVATVITFLLDSNRPVAYLHRMSADAVHYFHQGGPLVVVTVSPKGELSRTVLGNDIGGGQQLQVVVPGGWWKGFEHGGGPWSLIGEAVAPGWVVTDDETATLALARSEWNDLAGDIEHLIPGGSAHRPHIPAPAPPVPSRRPIDLRHGLELEPNLEGGYYRQTFESAGRTSTADGPRPLLNTIFYLLTADSPIGHLHLNRSAITHFHHLGGPSTYVLVAPSGNLEEVVLGPDLAAGHVLSFTCPGGWWKASHILAPGATDCLVSEAVAPGFRYDDHRMATFDEIAAIHPSLIDQLAPLILR